MYDELAWIAPFIGFPRRTLGYGTADTTLDLASQLVSRLPEPFFLFVHVHEPHNPYRAPPPYRGKYAKIDYRQADAKISSEYYNRYPLSLQPFVDVHRDHYDESIEYLDSELKRFVMFFDQNQKSKNSLLIITGDHGESFERGFLNHGEDLYETSVHVPLIIHFPGQKVGFRSSAPVQSIDIAPTILRVAGAVVPEWIDGVSLTGDETSSQRQTVIVNYKDPEGRKTYDLPTKVAVESKQDKLIVDCESGKPELYDLLQDPGEKNDLSSLQTVRVNQLWKELNQKIASQQSARKLTCQLRP
jgi:arylsulfatase A-like enzyme